MENKALFLDRDGVINKAFIYGGRPYPPSKLEEVTILDGVKEALILSKKMGFLNIIVTNQPDASTGKQDIGTIHEIHTLIKKSLPIDDIFVCFHLGVDNCSCRKPLPGMLFSAQEKWKIDFSKSFLVGDRWRDIGASQAVGCKSFFIDYNYQEKRPDLPYDTVSSLREAVERINIFTSLNEGEELSELKFKGTFS